MGEEDQTYRRGERDGEKIEKVRDRKRKRERERERQRERGRVRS